MEQAELPNKIAMTRKCYKSGVNLHDSGGRAEHLRGELMTYLGHGGVCRENVGLNSEVQLQSWRFMTEAE